MHGKKWIALLMISFALCNPLTVMAANVTAVGGGYEPDTRLPKDKLRYKAGGPKAATTTQKGLQAVPPHETPQQEQAPQPSKRNAPSTQ